jgi:hypothetical protein
LTEVTPPIPPESLDEELHPSAPGPEPTTSRGFWAEAWRRFRRRKLAMAALIWVLLLVLVAALAPAIVGTKPLVVKYQDEIYFPAMGYFSPRWENAIFARRPFRKVYTAEAFQKGDPNYWAVWPLMHQDPYVRVDEDRAWPGQPANPYGDQGRPSRFNLFGTDQQGIDVFAQMVHATLTALLVGFVSTGIAAFIGIPFGALAGYLGGWLDMLLPVVGSRALHPAAGTDSRADRDCRASYDLARDGGAGRDRLDEDRAAHQGRVHQAEGKRICDGGALARFGTDTNYVPPHAAQLACARAGANHVWYRVSDFAGERIELYRLGRH